MEMNKKDLKIINKLLFDLNYLNLYEVKLDCSIFAIVISYDDCGMIFSKLIMELAKLGYFGYCDNKEGYVITRKGDVI